MGRVTVNEHRTEQLVGLVEQAANPPTTEQIAEAAGLSKQSATMYLCRLSARGLLRRVAGYPAKAPRWERATYDDGLQGDLPKPWRLNFAFQGRAGVPG